MKIIWSFTLMMIPGVVSSVSVTENSGGRVNITCRFDEGHTENIKFSCKGEWPVCIYQIKTNEKDSGRFSLYGDTRSGVFTVTIRDLRKEDSGTYRCGADRPNPNESDLYTEANKDDEKKQTTAPPLSSSSYSPSSPSSSSSSSSLVICVTVILLLLIIGFLFCMVTLYKKHHRDRDSASKTSETGKENREAVPQPLYEEIKDARLHIDCRNTPLPKTPSDSSRTVYATAKLPTNPSDSSRTVYVTAELPTNPSVEWHKRDKNQVPTNPSDSSVAVYATPQLPTNPSDSSIAVHATPQLPTNPSDSPMAVYATPQLPTYPSDSSKAAEELR